MWLPGCRPSGASWSAGSLASDVERACISFRSSSSSCLNHLMIWACRSGVSDAPATDSSWFAVRIRSTRSRPRSSSREKYISDHGIQNSLIFSASSPRGTLAYIQSWKSLSVNSRSASVSVLSAASRLPIRRSTNSRYMSRSMRVRVAGPLLAPPCVLSNCWIRWASSEACLYFPSRSSSSSSRCSTERSNCAPTRAAVRQQTTAARIHG